MKAVLEQRVKTLQKTLGKKGCLIEDPINLFYLTGLKFSAGKLLLSKAAALLLVDKRYIEIAQCKAPVPVALDHKNPFLDFSKQHQIQTWLFDPQSTSYERFTQLEKWITLTPNKSFFETVRLIKDESEIAKMKKSARLLWKGFLFIKKSLKLGIREKELAHQFTLFCLENGASGLSFEPIISFGANSAMPHYRAGNTRLKKNDLVLIDIGVIVDEYHSDMTRCLFFKQEDPVLAHLYTLVKEAQATALALCYPGVKIGKLDEAVRAVFKKEGVEDLFIHALGHGVGLKIHEFPRIKYDGKDKETILKRGMVFTIEPGLYLPGKGGVRYEDTVLITENGYTNFY